MGIAAYAAAAVLVVALAAMGLMVRGWYKAASSRQGEKEREADLDEANERIRERSRRLSIRDLGERLRKAARRR